MEKLLRILYLLKKWQDFWSYKGVQIYKSQRMTFNEHVGDLMYTTFCF